MLISHIYDPCTIYIRLIHERTYVPGVPGGRRLRFAGEGWSAGRQEEEVAAGGGGGSGWEEGEDDEVEEEANIWWWLLTASAISVLWGTCFFLRA